MEWNPTYEMPGDALPLCSGGRGPDRRQCLASPPPPPPSASGAKCQGGVESERKDKWRRKITAVLRTNDQTNERRTTTKTCPPSSLPPSFPRPRGDGRMAWRHRHATFCNASTLRRNWSNGRTPLPATQTRPQQTMPGPARTVVGWHGRWTDWAGRGRVAADGRCVKKG